MTDVPAVVDDPHVRTFGLLLEAHAHLTRTLDRRLREDAGTTLQTLEVLLRVGRAPSGWVPVSRLADSLALTSGGISRLVDRLQRDGLLCREPDPADRRVVQLRLTPAGSSRLAAALEVHRRHLDEEVTSRLDPEDEPVLQRCLDGLRGARTDVGDPPC